MTGADGKRLAADAAAERVKAGMRVGLGTGSTAALFVDALGRRVAGGLDIVGVPTSEATARQAASLGIPLRTLEEEPELDLAVDGADEIDPALDLLKGGGGALLREKLVASASRRLLVIADGSKRVDALGRFPLPVEIVPFGVETTRRRIAALLDEAGHPGAEIRPRQAAEGRPFRTDGGHLILDLWLGRIADAAGLGAALKATLGVVEHGLFVGLASAALVGGDGGVVELRPSSVKENGRREAGPPAPAERGR